MEFFARTLALTEAERHYVIAHELGHVYNRAAGVVYDPGSEEGEVYDESRAHDFACSIGFDTEKYYDYAMCDLTTFTPPLSMSPSVRISQSTGLSPDTSGRNKLSPDTTKLRTTTPDAGRPSITARSWDVWRTPSRIR